MKTNTGYGLITRLMALRDLLRKGPSGRAEICRALPGQYQADASGARRLGRDVSALRQLGYTITIDRSTHAYTLQETSFLELSPENVQALALVRETFETLAPISLDVLAALERIVAALPASQRELYFGRPALSIRMKPAADYRPYLKTIRLLQNAIEQSRKIRFVYPVLDERGAITHLGVEPYEIQFFDRHFYLLGFTPHDPEMMEFRIDRLQNLEIMTNRAARQRSRKTLPFTYRLSERIARMGISERFYNQRVEIQPDGSAIVQAEGYSAFRIIQDLLRYGEQAELLGPPELRARMGRVVEALALLYADAQDK